MTAAVAAARPVAGTALPPEYAAYEAYLDHQKGCRQCRTSLHVCSDGAVLWTAFKVALPSGSASR